MKQQQRKTNFLIKIFISINFTTPQWLLFLQGNLLGFKHFPFNNLYFELPTVRHKSVI